MNIINSIRKIHFGGVIDLCLVPDGTYGFNNILVFSLEDHPRTDGYVVIGSTPIYKPKKKAMDGMGPGPDLILKGTYCTHHGWLETYRYVLGPGALASVGVVWCCW